MLQWSKRPGEQWWKLIDIDVIVPEDGEEQIERVMLPHIEEVNKLTIMYVINIVLSSY